MIIKARDFVNNPGDILRLKIRGQKTKIRIMFPDEVITEDTLYREYSDPFEYRLNENDTDHMCVTVGDWMNSGAVGDLVKEHSEVEDLISHGRHLIKRQYVRIVPFF